MSDVETNFEESGSLKPPAMIGRLVRLLLGLYCIYAGYQFFTGWQWIIEHGFPLDDASPMIGVFVALYLIPYVINIGWSLNLKRKPQILVIFVSLLLIGYGFASNQYWETAYLDHFTLFWTCYVYWHLGLSFVLSAIIATPGCEMRSIPHLISLITGNKSKEHYCPGPLRHIDDWESKHFSN